MSQSLPYLAHYPEHLQTNVQTMLEQKRLGEWLRTRYPDCHNTNNNNDLREYVLRLKNRYMKKTQPLSKVVYDDKIHIVKHA